MMTKEKLERIQFATRNYRALQGLKRLPLGLFFLFMSVLTLNTDVQLTLEWATLGFAGFLLYLVLTTKQLEAYYIRRFGYTRPTRSERRGRIAFIVLLTLALPYLHDFIVSLAGRSGLFSLIFAMLALEALWKAKRRPSLYAIAIPAAIVAVVLALELLPLPHSRAITGFSVLVAGLMLMLQGLLDHRFLVETLKPMQEPEHEHAL